ncbi:restriction endonuclease subunit S [Campylobacter vicugnae]|uniref:restriction endonuclease subunit S n=1 Tax=Campylobacter vicugnae TaxID=1660076 RepID=UPI000A32E3DF|nr:restriction endonuclease subunit S [Campylobacter sp. S0112]
MAKIKKDTNLRKAILQAAITGQLISNVDGATETGKQLLDRIIEERNAKLLADWEEAKKKNPKAKKPTPIVASEIAEDEIPFEIPKSWCWCRLGEICNEIKRGKSPKYAEKSDYLAFAQKCNAKTGEIDLGLALYLDEKTIGRYSEEDNLIQGDIVINSTGGGTMGRVGYYETKVPAGIKGVYPDSHVTVIRSIGNLNQKYLYYFLKLNQPILEKCGTGSTNQTELKPAVLSNFLIPLPPLAVQNAIVAKLEEVLPLVDAYENAVLQKEELKTTLPDKVKKAILQEAIQGKLTESWRKTATIEETGKQLLDRIIEERNAKLLADWEEAKKKNQKAKKPAPIVASEIAEDEIPFEIPESWCWCRLGEIINYKMGKTPPRAESEWWGTKEGTPWISIADMVSDGYINTTKETMSSKSVKEIFNNNISKAGTLIMSFKLTVGRVSILNIDATHNEAIISIFPFIETDNILRNYLFKILPIISQNGETKDAIKGKTLNSSSIYNITLPLPPLDEQKKIVEILEQMLPLCEKLRG